MAGDFRVIPGGAGIGAFRVDDQGGSDKGGGGEQDGVDFGLFVQLHIDFSFSYGASIYWYLSADVKM